MNKLFLILALMAINSHIYTQEAKEEMLIRASIQNIFDGMRAGDSSKVAKSFFRKAVMFSNFSNKEGQPVVKKGSLDKWLGGIGSPHDEIWDERISNLKIDVDGEVATSLDGLRIFRREHISPLRKRCFPTTEELRRMESGQWPGYEKEILPGRFGIPAHSAEDASKSLQ